jgi:hypothetical protein
MGRNPSCRGSAWWGAAVLATTARSSLGLVALVGTPANAAPVSFSSTGATQTYVVPADGSVCRVTLDAAGANGGAGDFVGTAGANGGGGGVRAASVGGTGGTSAATFPVVPGQVITVDVGGAGGSGADQSQAGGFGGGGDGGNGATPGPADDLRGGGGGGATTFRIDGVPMLIAGGGGGGGAYNADGGNGGSAGGAGAPGEDVSGNLDSGWGQSATGGTTSGGGTGGTTGVPPGNALTGGDGSLGGGGGGASTSGSGGGGGGGSSVVAPPGFDVNAGSLVQDADGNGAATITPAGSACDTLTVHKVVLGTAAAGTQFRVHVSCTTGESADMRFDVNNAPLTPNSIAVRAGADCTVQETGRRWRGQHVVRLPHLRPRPVLPARRSAGRLHQRVG